MKNVFLYFFLFTWFAVAAQDIEPFFKAYNTENGLSNSKVNTILEDSRGFIWIGTEDGLNRYDGRYFTVYRSEPHVNTGLSGNIITDLLEDKNGIIWIATADGGITKYDYRLPAKKQFKQYKHSEKDKASIPENTISKIVDDSHGNLWLATSGHYVVCFNKKTNQFSTPVKKGTRGILSLAIDSKDTLWVGRAGGGILKINIKTLGYKSDSRYDDLYKKMPHVSVTAIYKDKANNIWYGSWDENIYHYNSKARIETAYVFNKVADEIVSFSEDKNTVWMASKNSGLRLYNKKTKIFSTLRSNPLTDGTIASDHTNVVYVDKKGIVWVGTSNGLNMYNPLFTPFKQYNLPKANANITIYDFFKDNQKRLWIGTSEGIFIKSDGNANYEHRRITFKNEKLEITKFYKDVDGTMYLGTNYSLFKYNMSENKIELLPNTENDPVMKQIISSRIVSIVRDTIEDNPVLVVSPYGHYLTYYDLKNKKWISRQDKDKQIIKKLNLQDNLIRKFYKDNNGKIWLATNHYGLALWPNKSLTPITYFSNDPANNSSISSNHIFDIQQDLNNNFWVSTYGGGLNYYEGIQFDRLGDIWMICNGHIHKYEPHTKIYSCYDLPNLQKSNSLKGYLYKDNQDNIYAAGENYYIEFDPKSVEKINHSPKVYLTDFKIFDKSYSHLIHQKKIQLKHFENYFTVDFAAPDFSGDNIKYAYKLEGLDKEWHEAGKLNTAAYSNLSPGKYKFSVRASNWIGGFTGTLTSIDIVISPPFWFTWWFNSLIIILLFAVGYLIYRYRINHLLKQKLIRNSIAQDLHDQVGSTLSSISIYCKVAKIYQEQNNPDQLHNVLVRISDSANEMISEMADIVWALNSKNDLFKSIVDRINHYAQPLCAAKNIKFVFECDPQLLDVNFGMQHRKNIYLIIKEAVNNSIKHAGCTSINISMKIKNQVITLEIGDDGIGFDINDTKDNTKLLSGNGLTNIRARAELKADIDVISTKEKGTGIKVVFKHN